MNIPSLFKNKICWIYSALLMIVIFLAVVLSVSLSQSSSEKLSTSLLLKMVSGIKEFGVENNEFLSIVEEDFLGIISFDVYPGKTIYYTTTKPGEGIVSSSKEKYPNINGFTQDWTKTALAVDYINDKLYVLDRLGSSIHVIDIKSEKKYHKTIKKDARLENSIDMVLDPYERFLFALTPSSILKVSLDGLSIDEIVVNSNMTALTIDHSSKVLYYSTSESIESFNYISSVKQKVKTHQVRIPSLSVVGSDLYIIEVKKDTTRSFSLITTLTNCHLVNGICSEYKAMREDDDLQSIKKFEKEMHSKNNPCMEKNGNCEQMCILLDDDRYRCLCQEGWKLNNDELTCAKSF